MRRSRGPALGFLVLGFLVLAVPAGAAPPQTDDASERLYLHYCSSCHGKGGKGDGTLAPILDVVPADLTQIAKKSGGGAFPYLDVLRAIDGRKTVRAHGTAEMPVWGEVFLTDPKAPLSEQLSGAGKLLLITMHLETLQEKPSGEMP